MRLSRERKAFQSLQNWEEMDTEDNDMIPESTMQRQEKSTAIEEEQETAEYLAFVEKFKPKKTTDDCYTPPKVYEAILGWVKERYQIGETTRIVRPFWPEADYQKADYSGDALVVDNPPFSILAKIVDYYLAKGVRFFLFCPMLTSLCYANRRGVTILTMNSVIEYENGAKVSTSFLCNLSPELRVEGASELYKRIDRAVRATQPPRVSPPKYSYPYEVATSAQLARFVSYGVDFQIPEAECVFIRSLDSQVASGKSIFGSGMLLSQRQAREQQAREQQAREQQERYTWTLSPRERQIVDALGGGVIDGLQFRD